MKRPLPESLITGRNIGDVISYGACGVYYDFMITRIEEELGGLPVVKLSARNMDPSEQSGYALVDKINKAGLVGILLGATDDYAESVEEGMIIPGQPVGLEIQIEGGIETTVFPRPETLVKIQSAA